MKKKTGIILGLLVVVIIILFLNITNRSGNKELRVIQIVPVEESQILASDEGLNVNVYFENDISKNIDQIRIEDNFGLEWQKNQKEVNMVSFSTSFGNEILAVEEIEMKLFSDDTLLKEWNYSVPFDEKAIGNTVEAVFDEKASFIPSEADVEDFKKEDEIINKEQPLWQLLPYETENFKISHYIEPLKLVVYIKSGDKNEIEVEVNKWIGANGGNSTAHTIEWR